METNIPKSKDLTQLEKLVGKIALFNNDKTSTTYLVKILSIETRIGVDSIHIKGIWPFRKFEHYEIIKPNKVWWEIIGDNSGMIYTSLLSPQYNWDNMISNATIVINQCAKLSSPNKK
jgi:hypothetical protein